MNGKRIPEAPGKRKGMKEERGSWKENEEEGKIDSGRSGALGK